ncbi:MAG: thrombospondin type 3 repeat-containing protein [candidate division Zixibacteria bacterium]|nr:thrombospondin type 3 repeat-containing protein [candidate division Zixibacteria bacterium]
MFLGVDTLNRISVACHELTHNLGMPDMYDYDDKLDVSTYDTPNDNNDHPVVDWCLMGYGGYGLLSIGQITPPHHIGWMKTQLGWIEPILLDQGEYSDLVIYNLETTPDSSLYKIPIDLENGEYFLLEYRNPQASVLFDKFDSDFSTYLWPWVGFGADSLDRGLLVTHIHDSLGADWWRINNGTPDYPHYTVAVVDAGYDPARDAYFNPEGFVSDSAQWWYPYETRKAATFSCDVPGQETLSPITTPSSAGYYGPTGIAITVDSIVGDRLYVTISTDQDFDGFNNAEDNCPENYNPGQEDGDSDGIGDVCDNCPGLYNPDQIDSDEDGFGELCDNCPDGYNPGQADSDSDGKGDVCDNCPDDYNPGQEDEDSDGFGELCDNCPDDYNPAQEDPDNDGYGSACDNCPHNYNPGQEDANENGIGDACDYICGDANSDDAINLLDILFEIDYLYGTPTGPAPEFPNAADVNADSAINLLDILALIDNLYGEGTALNCL